MSSQRRRVTSASTEILTATATDTDTATSATATATSATATRTRESFERTADAGFDVDVSTGGWFNAGHADNLFGGTGFGRRIVPVARAAGYAGKRIPSIRIPSLPISITHSDD